MTAIRIRGKVFFVDNTGTFDGTVTYVEGSSVIPARHEARSPVFVRLIVKATVKFLAHLDLERFRNGCGKSASGPLHGEVKTKKLINFGKT